MIWLDRLNETIDFIEAHLTEDIDYRQAAQKACCSVFQLQRMFPYIAGVSLAEYVRRRRLTLAAFELKNAGTKVIDLAIKYGYESPEAFSRAFKSLHGVMPSSARRKDTVLKAYPRMVFSLSVKGDAEMNYRIEHKEAFEVFGVSTEVHNDLSKAFREVPEFWDKCVADGSYARIKAATGSRENACLHGALFNPRDDGFSYMVCGFTPTGEAPADFERLSVPALIWAVFPLDEKDGHVGDQVQNTWRRVFTEWFPTSGYGHADGPEFEIYFDRGEGIYAAEVWIPVIQNDHIATFES